MQATMMPTDACTLPKGAPTTAFHFADLKLMSLICNGVLTSIERGKKKVLRYKVIGKYIAAKHLDIVGLH